MSGLVATILIGCTGTIGEPGSGGALGGSSRGNANGDLGSAGASTGEPAPEDFTTGPGLRRLTPTEYANTVLDLFGVDVSHEDRPKPLIVGGHSQVAGAQKTGYDDVNVFAELGAKVASAAVDTLGPQLTCADAACLRAWTSDILLRAFRAPPSASLLDRYAGILGSADAGDTQKERLATFVDAVLSSPYFLYKRELGTTVAPGDGSVRQLDSYEVATRLSYLAWQSGPDSALLAAAGNEKLLDPAVRLAQLDRMLDDQRAPRGLRGFVSDWMGLFDNNLSKKSTDLLAGLGADFPDIASQGLDLLIDDVLRSPNTARFSDLFKVDYAFADSALANVLGATTSGSGFQKVALRADQRIGILMQPMVLGAHTKESGVSPFPIGKFVFENVLCDHIPPPPGKLPIVDDSGASGQTLRQKLEGMTKNQPCISCHGRIGPPGFAFLPFDPVGRYDDVDPRGQPYDTTGSLLLPGATSPMTFTSAADLSVKLAGRPEVQTCLAKRFFRWTFGRFEQDADATTMAPLQASATQSSTGVTAMLRQIVSDSSFTQVRMKVTP